MISRSGLIAGLAVVAAVGVVAWFQLVPYADRDRPGISFDTPYYVWRTALVEVEGTGLLTELPDPVKPNPERPGFPVLGAVLGSITGADAFTFVMAARAVAAVAIGFSAGALALGSLGQPRWTFALFVVVLGTSAAVTGTVIGSLENALADVSFMALAGVVPLALHRHRALGAVFLLLTGAALIHWVFTCLFLLLALVAAGVALLLDMIGHLGSGRTIDRGRIWRLAIVALAAIALAALLMPALPHKLPPTTGARGNLLRLEIYELPLLLPLAALGAALFLRKADALGRTTALVLVVWAASVALAILLSGILPIPLKIFRVAAFALGVPALLAVGSVSLLRVGRERLGTVGVAIGVSLVLPLIVIAMPADAGPFNESVAGDLAKRFDQARIAGRYLGAVGDDRGVIFVVPYRGGMFDRLVRSAVPPEMIPVTYVYVGDEDNILATRASSDPSRPRLSASSTRWWRERDPQVVLDRDPIVIRIGEARGADGGVALGADGGVALGPGVHVLRGPAPPTDGAPPPPIHLSWPRLIAVVGASLLILLVVGFGWARSSLDVGTAASLGFAPAFGIAVLIVLGTIAARAGMPLGGPAGIAVVLIGVGTGWLPMIARSRQEPRGDGDG
jgi:hypothetical protein